MVCSLFFSFQCCLLAQKQEVKLQHFGQEEGLSSQILFCISQDSKGFIWIGTDYGLNRFDGREFKVYTKEKYGLSSNRVWKIVEDRAGLLWLSSTSVAFTAQGDAQVDIFNATEETSTPLLQWVQNPKVLEGKQALEVFLGRNNVPFITTLTGEIYQCTERKLRLRAKMPQEEIVTSIQEDDTGMWVSTKKQIYYINNKGNIILHKAIENEAAYMNPYFLNNPKEKYIDYTIGPISRYIGRKPHEIRRLYKDGRQQILYEVPADYIFLYADTDLKEVGVRTEGVGVFGILSFEEGSEGRFNSWGIRMEAIDQNWAMLRDKQQTFWYDDFPNGVARAKTYQNHFKHYITEAEWGKQHAARGIAQNTQGQLYFVIPTLKDVILHEAQETPKYKMLHLHRNNYLSILLQKDNLYAGAEGLLMKYSFLEQKQVEEYSYQDTLSPIWNYPTARFRHWSLFEDKQGRIWAGTQHGVSYLDSIDGKLHVYQEINGFDLLYQSTIYQFHENEAGIWLVSSTGLYLMQAGKGIVARFHQEATDADKYLPHNELFHLHEDSNGCFWLASKGGGLIKWYPKTKEYQQFTQENGLSHNVLYAVYPDSFGNLWLSSNRGIMRFNKESGFVSTYLPYDGISDEEFNRISHYQGADGAIYFGSLDGITAFHPKNFYVADSSKIKKPVIIEFNVQDSKSGEWKNLTASVIQNELAVLDPDNLGFFVKFASLNFDNQQKQQFAYMIQGFDMHWIYQQNSSIRINKLPYGEFKLLLKTQNGNGFWSDVREVKIEVIAPFYLRYWFLALMLFLLVISIFMIVKWRTYQLEKNKATLLLEVKNRTAQIEKDKATILVQKEELAKLDQLKSRFFANISHELRTPLTLILGPTKYTREQLDTLSLSEISHALQMVEKHGESLLGLVEELLELSKLEANEIKIELKPTDLSQLLAVVCHNFEAHAHHRNMQLQLDNWESKQRLLLDDKKIKKILNNLIFNALKFTPDQGSITVQAYENHEGKLQIDVADTGKGIHPDDLPHIFERFYQTKQITEKMIGGTGIGLALAKEFTELMSGKLTVESELGNGSIFSLQLPLHLAPQSKSVVMQVVDLHRAADAQSEGTEVVNYKEKTCRLLIVEDNPDMQTFISSLLQQQYHISLASNGVEALEILTSGKEKIDLMISDVMMPEMDGFELLEWVKQRDVFRTLPVIMLTAKVAEADKLHALTIGVDDYLTKPFSAQELKTRVKNLLANSKARQEWVEIPEQPYYIPYLESSDTAEFLETITEGDLKWVSQVAESIRIKLTDPSFTLKDIAEACSLSERQFQRKIKQTTGLTPVKYRQEIQLHTARELLEKGTHNSVATIANQVGFQTERYFSKLFVARFGKNPREYFRI